MNPYRDLPDVQFWSRSVSDLPLGHIDPVTHSRTIMPDEKVATLGSCFAQHISRHLAKNGSNYFVAEQAPEDMAPSEALAANYEVFSARYGNVYTVRQALQLFDAAFGEFLPADIAWEKSSGFVDPFRPLIDIAPRRSPDEVVESREAHLACVRRVFLESNWIVFTLGLTEAWRSRKDGAVYPLAPGVAGGRFDPDKHEFVNFTMEDVRSDLRSLVRKVRRINGGVKIILTVSPVPLIATYEHRHVLSSTCFSKAVLRVAADEIEREFTDVFYFPSYEIITSPAAGSRYYADDLREVTSIGVKHVMRMFHRHFVSARNTARSESVSAAVAQSEPDLEFEEAPPSQTMAFAPQVMCDEEEIEAALNRSGFGR